MKEQHYKQVWIESEDDLPKVTGDYTCIIKDINQPAKLHFDINSKGKYGYSQQWMKLVDSYFKPSEPKGLTDEEIKKYALENYGRLSHIVTIQGIIITALKEMRDKFKKPLQAQPSEQENHDTCDGCQMFQDCGCMLDDSCPECVDHHLWTPKSQPEKEQPSDDRKIATPKVIFERLKLMYNNGDTQCRAFVAEICDEILDKTGGLLGDIRDSQFPQEIKSK